jgi:hypothetical protein
MSQAVTTMSMKGVKTNGYGQPLHQSLVHVESTHNVPIPGNSSSKVRIADHIPGLISDFSRWGVHFSLSPDVLDRTGKSDAKIHFYSNHEISLKPTHGEEYNTSISHKSIDVLTVSLNTSKVLPVNQGLTPVFEYPGIKNELFHDIGGANHRSGTVSSITQRGMQHDTSVVAAAYEAATFYYSHIMRPLAFGNPVGVYIAGIVPQGRNDDPIGFDCIIPDSMNGNVDDSTMNLLHHFLRSPNILAQAGLAESSVYYCGNNTVASFVGEKEFWAAITILDQTACGSTGSGDFMFCFLCAMTHFLKVNGTSSESGIFHDVLGKFNVRQNRCVAVTNQLLMNVEPTMYTPCKVIYATCMLHSIVSLSIETADISVKDVVCPVGVDHHYANAVLSKYREGIVSLLSLACKVNKALASHHFNDNSLNRLTWANHSHRTEPSVLRQFCSTLPARSCVNIDAVDFIGSKMTRPNSKSDYLLIFDAQYSIDFSALEEAGLFANLDLSEPPGFNNGLYYTRYHRNPEDGFENLSLEYCMSLVTDGVETSVGLIDSRVMNVGDNLGAFTYAWNLRAEPNRIELVTTAQKRMVLSKAERIGMAYRGGHARNTFSHYGPISHVKGEGGGSGLEKQRHYLFACKKLGLEFERIRAKDYSSLPTQDFFTFALNNSSVPLYKIKTLEKDKKKLHAKLKKERIEIMHSCLGDAIQLESQEFSEESLTTYVDDFCRQMRDKLSFLGVLDVLVHSCSSNSDYTPIVSCGEILQNMCDTLLGAGQFAFVSNSILTESRKADMYASKKTANEAKSLIALRATADSPYDEHYSSDSAIPWGFSSLRRDFSFWNYCSEIAKMSLAMKQELDNLVKSFDTALNTSSHDVVSIAQRVYVDPVNDIAVQISIIEERLGTDNISCVREFNQNVNMSSQSSPYQPSLTRREMTAMKKTVRSSLEAQGGDDGSGGTDGSVATGKSSYDVCLEAEEKEECVEDQSESKTFETGDPLSGQTSTSNVMSGVKLYQSVLAKASLGVSMTDEEMDYRDSVYETDETFAGMYEKAANQYLRTQQVEQNLKNVAHQMAYDKAAQEEKALQDSESLSNMQAELQLARIQIKKMEEQQMESSSSMVTTRPKNAPARLVGGMRSSGGAGSGKRGKDGKVPIVLKSSALHLQGPGSGNFTVESPPDPPSRSVEIREHGQQSDQTGGGGDDGNGKMTYAEVIKEKKDT